MSHHHHHHPHPQDGWTAQLKLINPKAPVSAGDLFAITAVDAAGAQYLLASFHGDTDGLASAPVVRALHALAQASFPSHRLVFGLDANTYDEQNPKKQNVQLFADLLGELGLASCWGATPDVTQITTFNARTYLQPQLNKAIKYEDRDVKGDRNLKDFVIFYPQQFQTAALQRDNTGKRDFIENMVIPSLDFPSDHSVLQVSLSAL